MAHKVGDLAEPPTTWMEMKDGEDDQDGKDEDGG